MPVPSSAVLARWAVQFAPEAVGAARRLYAAGRFRQLAVLHARTLVDGTFSDEFVAGERVWVVWSGDDPVAAYPEPSGDVDLGETLARSRPERRRSPDELPAARTRRRLGRLARRSRTDDVPE